LSIDRLVDRWIAITDTNFADGFGQIIRESDVSGVKRDVSVRIVAQHRQLSNIETTPVVDEAI
jgi:hypothetical protein